MPPRNPKIGDTWLNDTGYTWGCINPGERAVWNGKLWVPTIFVKG